MILPLLKIWIDLKIESYIIYKGINDKGRRDKFSWQDYRLFEYTVILTTCVGDDIPTVVRRSLVINNRPVLKSKFPKICRRTNCQYHVSAVVFKCTDTDECLQVPVSVSALLLCFVFKVPHLSCYPLLTFSILESA